MDSHQHFTVGVDVSHPNIEILRCLETVVQALQIHKTMSGTKLKRTYDFDPDLFDAAVQHGSEKKVLKWGDRNMFTFVAPYIIPEEAYYESIEGAFREIWEAEGYDKSQFYLENTARRDSKIAGPWTRPDFTMVSYKKFPWTIGSEFDVVTFEVKRADTSNVLAVFEAMSHRSAATRSYVVFPLDEVTWTTKDPAQAVRVKDECIRHGIGLILVGAGHSAAVHAIPARRFDIDHRKSSDFLAAVLTEAGKNRIAEWK